MATAKIEKRYYNAESLEKSDIYAWMLINADLPPAPYVGMTVSYCGDIFELASIWWHAEEQQFSCTAKPSFLDSTSADSPDFDEWIEWQAKYGWILRGRHVNDSFVAKQENSTLDDCEKFRAEVTKLSEPARIEFRRRLDEAGYLGRLIAAEKHALEITREKLKSKTKEAKNLTSLALGGLVIMILIGLFFPEWIKGNSILLFLLSGWGLLHFAYQELICSPIASNFEKRQATYEDACYRWTLATGMRWGKKALAAECWSHNFSYPNLIDEDEGEIKEHFASVERSIMRIVKNRYALNRYDMD